MKSLVEPDFLLENLGLVDSAAEPEFDNLTRLAADTANAPVSLLSFVQHDKDRQYFKSRVGLELEQTPLSHSFCRIVVESGEALVVQDALAHPAVCANPAIADFNVHAYLGFPVTDPYGVAIASLCVIGNEPRLWRIQDIKDVQDLALCASTVIKQKWESAKFTNILRERSNLAEAIDHDLSEPSRRFTLIMDQFLAGCDKGLDPSQKVLLKIALDSYARTQGMREDLKDYSECATSEYFTETVDLNRLLSDTLYGLRSDILNFDAKIIASQLPTVHGNRHQLEILFRNLIRHVLVSHVPTNALIISIESASTGNQTGISFSYAGVGVLLRHRGRHTDQVHSMHSDLYASNGVGMALVERIVRNHLGSLSVNSADDNRAEYIVRLPIRHQAYPSA